MNAKPCPFCGHSGITIHEGSTFRWMVAECNDCGATAGEVRVQTMGDGDRKDWINNGNRDALDAWNVRATPTKEGRQMDSRAAFEAWWESDGQYVRAGGGQYEVSFAFAAWQVATERAAKVCDERAMLVSPQRPTPNTLNKMEQLIGFVEWERKHNPRKEHIADWALREIERLRERGT